MEPSTESLMLSRNTWRGMPAFSASTVISHRFWMTTPNMVLCAIFQMRASSPSPTHIALRPIACSQGLAWSYSALGPDATISSLPALATFALPETGAHRYATPSASRRSRTSAEPSCEIEELSMTAFGLPDPVTRPPSPNSTSFKSSVVDTIVNTTSHPARSSLRAMTAAPYSASGCAFDAVRFHTLTPWPALSRRFTMASPMRPRPIHPMRFVIATTSLKTGDASSTGHGLLPVAAVEVLVGIGQRPRRVAQPAAQRQHRGHGARVERHVGEEPGARIEQQVAGLPRHLGGHARHVGQQQRLCLSPVAGLEQPEDRVVVRADEVHHQLRMVVRPAAAHGRDRPEIGPEHVACGGQLVEAAVARLQVEGRPQQRRIVLAVHQRRVAAVGAA